MIEPGVAHKINALRFGVLCNGNDLQRWQADALKELLCSGHTLELLIIDARTPLRISPFKRLGKRHRKNLLFSLINDRFFKPEAKLPVNLDADFKMVPRLSCLVNEKGFSEYFKDQDLEEITKFRLDFILRFGFNILRGGILHAARYGVWSFHHGDELLYRGGPPGFWEIYRKDPVSGAILQRLTEKLDGGIILKKGYLKTVSHSYQQNLDQMLKVSAPWPAWVATQLALHPPAGGTDHHLLMSEVSTTNAPVYKLPGNFETIKFLWKLLLNRIRFYHHTWSQVEIWNVGIVRKPAEELALVDGAIESHEVQWLPPLSHLGYLADPFGFASHRLIQILAEEYHYDTGKAHISEMVVNLPEGESGKPLTVSKPVKLLAEDNHLSYPYTFEFGGSRFCVPESYQSSQIALYKWDEISKKFQLNRVLVPSVQAVDPTMIHYNNTWWLYFTIRQYSNTHLYLYSAKHLEDEFISHPQNPVKTDIRSARPAGIPIIYQQELFRPAQDCSMTYGGRIAINKVIKITSDEYKEETIRFLEPVAGSPYPDGIHTMSAAGRLTLIDGKRYRTDFRYLVKHLLARTGRKGGRDV